MRRNGGPNRIAHLSGFFVEVAFLVGTVDGGRWREAELEVGAGGCEGYFYVTFPAAVLEAHHTLFLRSVSESCVSHLKQFEEYVN